MMTESDIFDSLGDENGTLPAYDQLVSALLKECLPFYAVCSVVLAVGVPGNTLVLCVYWKKRQQSSANFYIWFLALVDLLVCTIILPHELYWCVNYYDYRSNIICKIFKSLLLVNVCTSGQLLVAIATDRYYAVVKPLSFINTVKRAQITACSVVCFCAIIATPAVFINEVKTTIRTADSRELSVCDRHNSTLFSFAYEVFCALLVAALIVVLVVLYWFVARAVIKRNTRIEQMPRPPATGHQEERATGPIGLDHTQVVMDQQPDKNEERSRKRENQQQLHTDVDSNSYNKERSTDHHSMSQPSYPAAGHSTKHALNHGPARQNGRPARVLNTVKMLVTVTAVFLLTWIPWMIISVIRSTGLVKETGQAWNIITDLFYCLLYINHGVNPIAYAFVSSKFRTDCNHFLERMCRRA
ncbi:orexin receptor type 2-like isoform X2 [Ptychodera flava]